MSWLRAPSIPPQRRQLIALVVVIVPLFAINAFWHDEGNTDVIAANVASWQLVRNGTLDLSQYEVITDNLDEAARWFVELPDGRIVSNRAPGVIFLGVPAYALLSRPAFSVGPGTVVAMISTTLAVLVVWHILTRLVSLRTATTAALVLALGTTTWWISSAQLWPHGPGQLWAAVALVGLSTSSYVTSGWAFAAAILTRPVTGVMALVSGLYESKKKKSLSPALRIGAVAAVGLAMLIVYNRVVFGQFSLRGGYSDAFTSGAVERFDVLGYLSNVFDMFLGFPHGFLLMSPAIAIGAIGVVLKRKTIPGWAMAGVYAGLAYLLLHAFLNRASAGLGAFYRYPLEPIVLATPALVLGAKGIYDRGGIWRVVTIALLVTSVALQVFLVFFWSCSLDPEAPACLTRMF